MRRTGYKDSSTVAVGVRSNLGTVARSYGVHERHLLMLGTLLRKRVRLAFRYADIVYKNAWVICSKT